MTCETCGATLQPESQFCIHCGTAVESKPKRGLFSRITRLFFGLILLALGGLGFMGIYDRLFGYAIRYWSNVSGAILFATLFVLFGLDLIFGFSDSTPAPADSPADSKPPESTIKPYTLFDFGCAAVALSMLAFPLLLYFFLKAPAWLPSPLSLQSAPETLLIEPAKHIALMTLALYISSAIALTCLYSFFAPPARWTEGVIGICFLAVTFLIVYRYYDCFVALQTRNGSVQLHYLWPRSTVALDAKNITDVNAAEELLQYGERYRGIRDTTFTLAIRDSSKYYQSEAIVNEELIRKTMWLVKKEQYSADVAEFRSTQTHHALAVALNELARVKLKLNLTHEARAEFEEALELLQNSQHRSDLANTLFGLAQVAEQQKEFSRAEDFYGKALSTLKELNDWDDPRLYDVAWAHAGMLRTIKRPEDAEEILRQLPPYTLAVSMRRNTSKEEAERQLREMLEKRRARKQE